VRGRSEITRDWIRAVIIHQSKNVQSLFLLLAGEGQDEGERQNKHSIPDATFARD
jgi:hypothetical protein